MKLAIPELSLVVLIGPSGAGKSTFARRHFKATEVLSSDVCRGLVSDDENSQAATRDAFDVLHFIAAKRLAAGKLTVVDATNVQPEARKPLVTLAREYHCLPVAIVLNTPEKICHERNRQRPDRDFGPHVIRRQIQDLRRSLRDLQREGFRHVFVLSTREEIETAVVEREPLWNNLKHLHGPFDIVGDVHGCFDELAALLGRLGYTIDRDASGGYTVTHPEKRTVVLLGDLVDRGPNVPEVLRLVMAMVASGSALCVPGNHDIKLVRKLRGKDVQLTHGLAETMAQLEGEMPEFKTQAAGFIDRLVSHYVLDDGKLVVAHAGMPEAMQGRGSGKVRDFALYGETTGETDEFGLPVRVNWAADYRGKARVVYGHTPVASPEWLNNTINIDTGCVFGGSLTALRYPELELVSLPARATYAQPLRPVSPEDAPPSMDAQQRHDDVLDLADVMGKRTLMTPYFHTITIREEQAITALEVISRFAVEPQWLIYLPPTMSPPETSTRPGLLEHPAEALGYYRAQGVPQVICEEKHMGSRAVVIVCRSEDAARQRFGVAGDAIGVCYTRTGRRFFDDRTLEAAFLAHVQQAVTGSGLWEEYRTDWLCLDSEILPWSAKAQGLIRGQYAAVGAAAQAALGAATGILEQTAMHRPEMSALLARTKERAAMTTRYVAAYRQFVWPVNSLADLKLAPFHMLASEGAVHADRDHLWHMQMAAKLAQAAPDLIIPTGFRVIDLSDPAGQEAVTGWWEELTGRGGEGMVVKPWQFLTTGRRGLIQPAIKCRGRDYLRLIYGPEYTATENLERLRDRKLGVKRGLALREFALGLEALERFVRREPLRRVHECVFGLLALESEAVDPRL